LLLLDNFLATANPSEQDIEDELCAAPQGPYSHPVSFAKSRKAHDLS
jgi:hypothetical protein